VEGEGTAPTTLSGYATEGRDCGTGTGEGRMKGVKEGGE